MKKAHDFFQPHSALLDEIIDTKQHSQKTSSQMSNEAGWGIVKDYRDWRKEIIYFVINTTPLSAVYI